MHLLGVGGYTLKVGRTVILLAERRGCRRVRGRAAHATPEGSRAGRWHDVVATGRGRPVKFEGRFAKSPSFWIKDVDITRSYAQLGGFVLPVVFESKPQIRLLGPATLRMTHVYTEIDGTTVVGAPSTKEGSEREREAARATRKLITNEEESAWISIVSDVRFTRSFSPSWVRR
jgi:hypothetical protein